MAAQPIELVYVGYRSEELRQVLDAGVRTFLVDREWRGKERRQLGQDTEIDVASREDLAAATALPGARVWCRINSFGNQTPQEVEEAIAVGVDCVFLPMVRTIEEVRGFLALVVGRCKTAILVETDAAVSLAPEFGRMGLDFIYVGLNDLAIDRGYTNIFRAVADGTVERVREAFPDTRFGFAGMTDVHRGDPIPAHLILRELHRLESGFCFCRRSFRRDTQTRDMAEVVAEITALYQGLSERSTDQVQRDRLELVEAIRSND